MANRIMNRILTNALFSLMIHLLNAQEISVLVPETLFYGPDFPKEIRQFDTNGNKTGEWKWFFNTGRVRKVEHYKNGRLNGKWQQFADDGQLLDQREFINDTMLTWMSYASMTYQCGEFKGMILENGRVENHDPQGNLESIGMIENGVQTGQWNGYFASGKLRNIKKYNKGKLEGTEIVFYESGSIKNIRYYVNNQPQGPMGDYFENGKLMTSGHFEKGKQIGTWSHYYENGQLRESGLYENGQRVGIWVYYNERGEVVPQR